MMVSCRMSGGMWVARCQKGAAPVGTICSVRCMRGALGCGPAAMGEPLGEEQMPLWLLTILPCVSAKRQPNPSAEGDGGG